MGKKMIPTYLKEETWQTFKELCESEDTTMAAYMRHFIASAVAEYRREQGKQNIVDGRQQIEQSKEARQEQRKADKVAAQVEADRPKTPKELNPHLWHNWECFECDNIMSVHHKEPDPANCDKCDAKGMRYVNKRAREEGGIPDTTYKCKANCGFTELVIDSEQHRWCPLCGEVTTWA